MNFIRRLILGVLANAAALFAAHYFLVDFEIVGGVVAFFYAGIFLGILNTFLKPILKIVALPFVVLTMGIFLIFINAFLLWALQWTFENPLQSFGVEIVFANGIISILTAAVVLSAVNSTTHWLIKIES